MDYWPWWLGAAAFTTVSVGYAVLLRRPLGISGAVGTMVDAVEFQAARHPDLDEAALEAAMLEATRAQFGDAALGDTRLSTPTETPVVAYGPRIGWTASVVFLAFLIVGGFLGNLVTGGSRVQGMSTAFTGFFGDGPLAWGALLVGGLLIGFGTQMAGGCTTGNGLVGCARIQPGSLAATASFFGTGIVVSFLLSWVLG